MGRRYGAGSQGSNYGNVPRGYGGGKGFGSGKRSGKKPLSATRLATSPFPIRELGRLEVVEENLGSIRQEIGHDAKFPEIDRHLTEAQTETYKAVKKARKTREEKP